MGKQPSKYARKCQGFPRPHIRLLTHNMARPPKNMLATDFHVSPKKRQCTRELWSYHLGTRHISNSSSVRQRSVNPSSIAGEYFLYLTSKRLACGLIHCRNAWFASTKL